MEPEPDVPRLHYKDLLSAFHAHGVKYLIVGGYGVIFHAQPRATKDIDLFIKATLPTRKRHMRRLPGLAHRSKISAGRILPTAAAFFASDTTRARLIFCPIFRASILTRHGNGALEASLTRKAASRCSLFRRTILSPRNLLRGGHATSPMLRTSARRRRALKQPAPKKSRPNRHRASPSQ